MANKNPNIENLKPFGTLPRKNREIKVKKVEKQVQRKDNKIKHLKR